MAVADAEQMDVEDSGVIDVDEGARAMVFLKKMKAAVDTDGNGSVSDTEMDDAIKLLEKLKTQAAEKNNPCMHYLHLPESIQDVFKEWDTDGSGSVSAAEIQAAAKAFKKIQDEGRMMRKIILGLSLVLLLLLVGVFALSFVAAELAKEMKAGNSGVMKTSTGDTVKVASSDFQLASDGTLQSRPGSGRRLATECLGGRCLAEDNNKDGTLQVATRSKPAKLSSTLPDNSFKELKELTLKATGDGMLKLSVTSFLRVRVRSSKCGSVVKLQTNYGMMTLDDYDMEADDDLLSHAATLNLGHIFSGGKGNFGGRRMSATDGMLEGFFNLLDKMDWQCDSMPLERPGSLPKNYVAKIQVKSLVKDPTLNPRSELFAEENGTYILLPGFEQRPDGRYVRVWNETMLHGQGIDAFWSTYYSTPGMAELRVKAGGAQLEMDVINSDGYNCAVMTAPKGAMENTDGISDKDLSLEFMGIQESRGVVLRHFRMYLTQELEKARRLRRLTQGNGTNTEDMDMGATMMEAGTIPNVMDYFDVDSDPSGKLEAGAPFRLRFFSTVSGSDVWSEKEFFSFTPLDGDLTTKDVLDYFGVQRVEDFVNKAGSCACDQKDTSAGGNAACAVVKKFPDTTGAKPPRLDPYGEDPDTVSFFRSKLMVDVLAEIKGGGSTPDLTLAKQTYYWSNILFKNKYGDVLTAAVNANNVSQRRLSTDELSTEGNMTSPERRLFRARYSSRPVGIGGHSMSIGADAGRFSFGLTMSSKHGKISALTGHASGCGYFSGLTACGGGGISLHSWGLSGYLDISAGIGVCCGVSVTAGIQLGGSLNWKWCITQLYAKPYVSVWIGKVFAKMILVPKWSCNYNRWVLELRAGYELCPWWCYSDDFRILRTEVGR